MKPESRSQTLLGITRSKAKMIEFSVPPEHHITPTRNSADLFPLTVGIVGDLAAQVARGGPSATLMDSAKQELRFSAFFFDAFLSGGVESKEKSHLTTLAASAYYLCGLPGSSAVLAKQIPSNFDLECAGLDRTLVWFLAGRFVDPVELDDETYSDFVSTATIAMCAFYTTGVPEAAVLQPLRNLRSHAYQIGSPRELLLADLIFAIAKRRLESSARASLPKFTDLDVAVWENALGKPTFIREFWPAQRLLGEQGVFRGRSAVIQMPTSAGKTKATDILIRSAFLSNRTDLAIIVAPFRALCHEIRDSMIVSFRGESVQIDEVSDVPQGDFDFAPREGFRRVVILTPEKLLYILRHAPEIATTIGVLIYDEGHQFDCGVRGITYELLVTSLKKVVPVTSQVVLISAVITNADAINQWLNGEEGIIVSGADLHPTLRSTAFASWIDTLGRLEFLRQPDSGDYAYFVPRILEATPLKKRSKREVVRYFPTRTDGQSVALYLALKLVDQGSVAIFCGLKGSVGKVCEKLVQAYERQLNLPTPLKASDAKEVKRLAFLVKRHLGEHTPVAKCADMGVFTHHGSTPAGIRLSVEHAMKESLVKMVVCTSTLAQGVNLPIRYLIVTGTYQGAKRISVRDFQNLIGRAGRSGMHTEGSVIFADPETYDRRLTWAGRWQWAQVEELFDPLKAEACASSLLTLFDPLESNNGKSQAKLNVRVFFQSYLEIEGGLPAFASELAHQLGEDQFSVASLVSQLKPRGEIIEALESYMMSASAENNSELNEDALVGLARGTLAYHLASPAQRGDLEELFRAVGNRVKIKVPTPKTRGAYAKSLLGVTDSLAIHEWVIQNQESLIATSSDEELLQAIWPTLTLGISSSVFVKCTKPELLAEIAARWIDNQTPAELLAFFAESDIRFGKGANPRRATIDHVVDLCENALAFEGVLVLAAICESLRLESADESLISRIGHLQKRLKYGLSSAAAITLHEFGFADRVVASDLAKLLNVNGSNKRVLRRKLRTMSEQVEQLLNSFPSYFSFVAANI